MEITVELLNGRILSDELHHMTNREEIWAWGD